MGITSLLADFNTEMKLEVLTDVSAANGIASKAGLGTTMHIEVHYLWVRERVRKGNVILLTRVQMEKQPSRLIDKTLGQQSYPEAHGVHRTAVSKRQIRNRSCFFPHGGRRAHLTSMRRHAQQQRHVQQYSFNTDGGKCKQKLPDFFKTGRRSFAGRVAWSAATHPTNLYTL